MEDLYNNFVDFINKNKYNTTPLFNDSAYEDVLPALAEAYGLGMTGFDIVDAYGMLKNNLAAATPLLLSYPLAKLTLNNPLNKNLVTDIVKNQRGMIRPKGTEGRELRGIDFTDEVLQIPKDSFIYSDEYANLKNNLRKHSNGYKRVLKKRDKELGGDWSKDYDDYPSYYTPERIEEDLKYKYGSKFEREPDWIEVEDEFFPLDSPLMFRDNRIKDAYKNAKFDYDEYLYNRYMNQVENSYGRKYNDWVDRPDSPFSDKAEATWAIRSLDDDRYDIRKVAMTPKEYLEQCAWNMERHTPFTSTYEGSVKGLTYGDEGDISAKYAEDMLKGDKFPTPWLEYANGRFSQEGRHRALAAMLLGEETIPVHIMKKKY